ncbi:MAG: hypothetical protein IJP63_00325 [Acholeplasmatales bacterium]|nr:hypothetical protein [Acholeplasmatales bacterium]
MDNFFTDINPKFFNVFTNKNREINYDLLSIINNNIEANVNNTATREEMINWITSYYNEHPTTVVYDDDTNGAEDISEIDIKRLASDKIRYFVNTGWLNDEEDSNFNISYMVDENAILLLKAMAEITKNRTNQNELYGYVYNIYNAVKNFTIDQAVGITEQIVSMTKQLVSLLRGVNNIVKKYLSGLLSNPYLTPVEILDKLLVDYNDKVVLKTLQNLRQHDNPAMYRKFIKDKLELIFTDHRTKLIELYIRDKKSGKDTVENISEADLYFRQSFDYVIDTFENIDELISILNKNNSKYVSNAKARTNFLLNDSGRIDGVINNILKNISEIDFDEFLEDGESDDFNIYDLGNIDEASLYKPRSKSKTVTDVDAEVVNEIPQEKLEELALAYFKDNKYSSFAINKYVMESMKNKNFIEAKELIEESKEEDSLKHFLVLLYSTNSSIEYKVRFDSNLTQYKKYGIMFDNFIIERKK